MARKQAATPNRMVQESTTNGLVEFWCCVDCDETIWHIKLGVLTRVRPEWTHPRKYPFREMAALCDACRAARGFENQRFLLVPLIEGKSYVDALRAHLAELEPPEGAESGGESESSEAASN